MSESNLKRKNPFVGPRPYETGEPLYGRSLETSQLTNLLLAERIVLLHSPSGAGKTSLIQAALIPNLNKRKFPQPFIVRLNLDPPAEFAAAAGFNRYIFSVLTGLEQTKDHGDKLPEGELADKRLAEYLEKEGIETAVLVFDQFEEVLTLNPTDHDAKTEFFEQIGQALRVRSRWALFSMREDYIGALNPYLLPLPTRFKYTYRLDLLDRDAARQVMVETARGEGVDFTDQATEKLVDDLRRVQVQRPDGSFEEQAGMYVEPVQLQVVCSSLWEKLDPDDTDITLDEVESIGDVDQSLAEYYAAKVEAVANEAGQKERDIREWFEDALITEGGIRSQVLMGAEQSDGLDNEAIWGLENVHLVRRDTRRGTTWFELAHDRLIQPVRGDNATWFQAHLSLLQRQASLWERQNRPDTLYLRDEALVKAENWAAGHPDEMSDIDVKFLEACQEVRQREREGEERERREQEIKLQAQRRWVRILGGLLIFTVIAMIAAVILGITALNASTEEQAASTQARENEVIAITNENKATAALATAVQDRANSESAQATAESDRATATSVLATAVRDRAKANAAVQTSEAAFSQVLENEEIARAWKFADEVPNLLEDNLDLALLLGVEAYRAHDMLKTRQVLGDAISHNWELSQFLHGNTNAVSSLAWSDKGQLASGSSDGTIIVWDVGSGRQNQTLVEGNNNTVSILAWSRGGRLASVSEDGTIKLWDVENEEVIRTLNGPTGTVNDISWSEDERLASASEDGTVIVWDAENGLVEWRLEEHTGSVNSVAWSADERLASGSNDGDINLWNLETGDRIQRLPGTTPVISLAWSADGRLVSSLADGRVATWNPDDPTVNRILPKPPRIYSWMAEVPSVRVGWLDDTMVSYYSIDQSIMMALSSVSRLGFDRWSSNLIGHGHTSVITSLARSTGGRLASGAEDGTVIIWDLIPQQPNKILEGHIAGVNSTTWLDEGRLASGSNDGTIIIWDVESREVIWTLEEHTGPVNSVAWTEQGGLASGSVDGKVIIWDAKNGLPETSLEGHFDSVLSVAWSDDGRLASGSKDGIVIVWNMDLGEPELILGEHSGPVYSVAWSMDGLLASGSGDGNVIVWNLSLGEPELILEEQFGPVHSVAWSTDGQLASGTEYEVTVLNPATGETELLSEELFGTILSVAWSNDEQLAFGSSEGTIFIWDPDAKQAERFLVNEWSVNSISWSNDGQLASGSKDGLILIWPKVPEELDSRACHRVGRNFTLEEWAEYFEDEVEYRPTCEQFPIETLVQTATPTATRTPTPSPTP